MTESMLWAARLGVLALMYLFVLALILALRADAKAATAPALPRDIPEPSPEPTRPPTPIVVTGLTCVSGAVPATGGEIPLITAIDIGRDPACQVTIANRFVSSRHARIAPGPRGWVIEDLGSTNGTLLNGAPLTIPQTLNPGDRIVIGDTELIVR